MILSKTNWITFCVKNPEVADLLLRKILQAERERKGVSGYSGKLAEGSRKES